MNGYDFFEAKFYDSPMILQACKKEEEQVRSIKNMACKTIGFVCSAGFDFEFEDYKLITGETLYN